MPNNNEVNVNMVVSYDVNATVINDQKLIVILMDVSAGNNKRAVFGLPLENKKAVDELIQELIERRDQTWPTAPSKPSKENANASDQVRDDVPVDSTKVDGNIGQCFGKRSEDSNATAGS